MIRKAVCFLLCLCFCFYSVSLNSSAVEDYEISYTLDDLIDLGAYKNGSHGYFLPDDFNFPTLFLSSSKNYNNFDINQINWSAMPKYIQDIVYLGISDLGKNYEFDSSLKVPFILVNVYSSTYYRVMVGLNVGIGRLNDTNGSLNVYSVQPYEQLIAPDDSEYEFEYIPSAYSAWNNSCLYSALFRISDNSIASDWELLTRSKYSNSNLDPQLLPCSIIYRYFDYNFANINSSADLYCYGGNFVWPTGKSPGTHIFPLNAAQTSLLSFYESQSGFGSGSYFFQDKTYNNIYCQKFIPKTLEQYNQQLQQEENETSKSIWETLKGIPEAIGEKIKGLFVPSEGFFNTYQQEFQTYFRERFGLLYEIPELVINLLNKILTFNPKSGDYSISFPEVVLPVLEDGEWRDEVLIEEQEFSFNFINDAPFSLFYDIYIGFIWLVYILLLVNLVKNKANSVFNGG